MHISDSLLRVSDIWQDGAWNLNLLATWLPPFFDRFMQNFQGASNPMVSD